MKVAGIVCEYNPFHNGHKYHIEKTREVCSADYVIAVMSGSFVQRGMPALISKYDRAAMALMQGIDMVIEIPVRYSTSSAEGYAFAACDIMKKTGIIDSICFGSETSSLDTLSLYADILSANDDSLNNFINQLMKTGITYPQARETALARITNSDVFELASPNNILAIEYIKALRGSSIKPFNIVRREAAYHDADTSDKESICSATAIRRILSENDVTNHLNDKISSFVPEGFSKMLDKTLCPDDFSMALYTSLLASDGHYDDYLDVSASLGNRISNSLSDYTCFTDFAAHLKTRQYTLSRIQRSLCHIMLGIKNDTQSDTSDTKYDVPYIRVLGFKKSSSALMKMLTNKSLVPVITKASMLHNLEGYKKKLLTEDIQASLLYEKHFNYKHSVKGSVNEYTRGMVIL